MRLQQSIQRVERLGNDVHISQDGHEVRVTIPARHNVPVEVSRQAGTSDLSQVQSDVEAVGRHGPGEHFGQFPQQLSAFQKFAVIEVGQMSLVGIGGDQQVAVVVGEPVQHDKHVLATVKDKVVPVVGRMIATQTEEALSRRGAIRRLDVRESPGGPEGFVRHARFSRVRGTEFEGFKPPFFQKFVMTLKVAFPSHQQSAGRVSRCNRRTHRQKQRRYLPERWHPVQEDRASGALR